MMIIVKYVSKASMIVYLFDKGLFGLNERIPMSHFWDIQKNDTKKKVQGIIQW